MSELNIWNRKECRDERTANKTEKNKTKAKRQEEERQTNEIPKKETTEWKKESAIDKFRQGKY